RPRMLSAQVGGVLVDLVVELLGDREDALARLLVDHRAAAERPRDRRLGNPGQVRDVQRCRLALDRHGDAMRCDAGIMPRAAAAQWRKKSVRAAGTRVEPER